MRPMIIAMLVAACHMLLATPLLAASSASLQIVRGVHPVLTVTIDGKRKARMLIDSGAAVTQLAPGFAPRGALADICLTATVCVKNLSVNTLSSTYSHSGEGYYNGLIGWDILKQLVTTIDYKAATVTFGASGGGTALRYTLDTGGRPQASISIAGVPLGKMLLDTGGSYVRVTPVQKRKLGSAFIANGTEVSLTMGKAETTTLGAPVQVCVATICAHEVTLQQARWPAIGGAFFRHFKLTIDGPAGVFRFAGAKVGALENALNIFGLQLSPDKASRIIVVAEGSPAAKAGITTSDTVVAINGKPVDALGYFGALAILESDKSKAVTLTLKGWTSKRDVTLARN
jgi:predicted aspartyl protease